MSLSRSTGCSNRLWKNFRGYENEVPRRQRLQELRGFTFKLTLLSRVECIRTVVARVWLSVSGITVVLALEYMTGTSFFCLEAFRKGVNSESPNLADLPGFSSKVGEI